MRISPQAAFLSACNAALFSATLLLSACGGNSPSQATPSPPAVIASLAPNPAFELDAFDIQGNYAYILADNGDQGSGSSAAQFYIVDITIPTSMAVISATPITGSIAYGQSGIRAQGNYVYLESSTGTPGTNLLQIYNVTNPQAPRMAGSVPLPLYSLGLWVSGQYAYAISYADNSALSDSSPGVLSIVDISNPASPTVIGSATTGTPGVHVADIKVAGNYAYVSGQSTDQSVTAQSRVLVFDVSHPAAPFLLSSLPAGHSPQGLDVEGNYWYQTIYDDTTSGNTTLNIYNISNPSAFYETGQAILSGACHPQDVTVQGTTAYVACYKSSSIAVVDVSTPSTPSVESYITLSAASCPIFLESKGRYIYSISNTPGGTLSVIDTGGA